MASVKSFVTLILIPAILLADYSAGSANSYSGRSARWDTYTQNEREKRSTANMEWQDKVTHPTCTLQDITKYDQHQRRASGVLATPQRQGKCGSCWAFCATHVFTDYLRLQGSHSTPVFSQDHMSKCIAPFRNRDQKDYNGCCGGNPYVAFKFLQDVGGVSESCLPYSLSEYNYGEISTRAKARNSLKCPSSCNNGLSFNPSNNRVGSFQVLSTEAAAIQALDRGQPIFAAMKTSPLFKRYRCGVYCGDSISNPNHAVEIVDYSSTSFPNTPYWVVKNSWGTDWGEAGYFRIARGRNQLTDFVTISTAQEASSLNDPSLFINTGDPQEPDTESENVMIESAAEFTIEAAKKINAFRCPEDNSVVARVTITSIVNETIQVFEGVGLDGIANVNIDGCPTARTGKVEYNVDVDLDDNFSIVTYRITIGDYVFNRGKGLGGNTAMVAIMILIACSITMLFV